MFTKKQIPNLLTISRFFTAFLSLFFYSLFHSLKSADISLFLNQTLFSLISTFFFIVCVITDFLDGYLARKWNATSSFGKVYDPIADKFLLCGFFIIFIVIQKVYFLIPLLLIIRDVLMDTLRLILYKKKIVVAAIKSAKIKTVLQMLSTFIILFLDTSNSLTFVMASTLLLPALFFSYLSFSQYCWKIKIILKTSE